MRRETLDQILKVIAFAAQRYSIGYGIDRPYQYGVKRVSDEYGVSYQTIGDACRRRLGLDSIDEFKTMLQACLKGNPNKLRELLVSKNPHYLERINNFFSNLEIGGESINIKSQTQEPFESYTIKLRKSDSDVLKALAQLLNVHPEEVLADVVVAALKDQMRKIVNKF